jgi:hypothetical protein
LLAVGLFKEMDFYEETCVDFLNKKRVMKLRLSPLKARHAKAIEKLEQKKAA